MNKISIIIDTLLCAAVVVLYVLFFIGKKSTEPVVVNAEGEVVAVQQELPVAYLNLDSLLVNYSFAIEANDKLMSKQEDARLKLNTRARTLQQEAADFQRKLDNNAFLSRERAESEANKLQRKQQELQELEAKLTQDIMLENQNLNLQLADTLTAFLEEYNADGRYKMIISNTGKDNVLMADPKLDITAEVIAALNARYHAK
ncbi:MAG: OmpH family outer membrane protein [Paludibacteraceae bacterium]|nr:OmpH family outer membrane protein [Paludibacteraceae bacterium]